MRLFRPLILVAMCASSLTLSPVSSAQSQPLPSVSAESCVIEPLVIPQPGESGDLTQATPTPTSIDQAGTSPADADVTAAVIAVVAQSIACANAGDELRMLACFSDAWVDRRFSGYDVVFYERFLIAAATATPRPPADQISLVALGTASVRADGGVLIEVESQIGGSANRSLLLLIDQDGSWRIDASEPIA